MDPYPGSDVRTMATPWDSPFVPRGGMHQFHRGPSRQKNPAIGVQNRTGDSVSLSGGKKPLRITRLVNPGLGGRQPFCANRALESVAALTTGTSATRASNARLRVREVVETQDRLPLFEGGPNECQRGERMDPEPLPGARCPQGDDDRDLSGSRRRADEGLDVSHHSERSLNAHHRDR